MPPIASPITRAGWAPHGAELGTERYRPEFAIRGGIDLDRQPIGHREPHSNSTPQRPGLSRHVNARFFGFGESLMARRRAGMSGSHGLRRPRTKRSSIRNVRLDADASADQECAAIQSLVDFSRWLSSPKQCPLSGKAENLLSGNLGASADRRLYRGRWARGLLIS